MKKNSKIYVAGHNGLVGTQLMQKLRNLEYTNIIVREQSELDLTCQVDVERFFEQERPEYVFLLAAKTGGVQVRLNMPFEMMYDNAVITLNVLQAAFKYDVNKLLYIASGLVYPMDARKPLKIESIGQGALGEADEPYALPKIMGIRLCQYLRNQYHRNFISCIPCNIYGEVRDSDTQFIPATIKKFANASDKVVIWGDGTPTREFLHGDDLASALVFLMERYNGDDPINIGTNEERSIAEVAEMLKNISGFEGEIKYDITKPNGAERLFMDSTPLIELGWQPEISLEDGLRMEYEKYKYDHPAD